MELRCRDHVVSLERMAIMGILNVTPDSFSDGGKWIELDKALDHAMSMIEEGAQIVDVGGESTRPGAADVSLQEELRRVIPVIERLHSQTQVPLSIDTRKPRVAIEAVRAGASIINDTSGEASDGTIDRIVAQMGAAIVIMHSRGTPRSMMELTDYDDVVDDVKNWLGSRASQLERRGVSPDSIVLDPGLGFAKTADQNLAILKRLEEITVLPQPVLVGSSRKSFIGHVLGTQESAREEGTIATVINALSKGARLTRVHDVGAVTRAVRMTEAIADVKT